MAYSIQNPDYYIKRLDKHNLDDVRELHNIVYGKKVRADFFKNKYNTAYTGAEYIGYVAYNAELVPIAFYAVIPCFFKYQGRLVLSAQSADTMTSPHYRFKGLFVELSNLTFKLCRDEGIFVVFGFPNQNSYPGMVNKLGWQITETLSYFIIPAARLSFEGLASKHPFLKKLYELYVKMILKRHLSPEKGIPNSMMAEGFAGVDHSEAYLAYKTYSNTFVMKLGETLIWLKISNGLTVGDILLNGEDFDAVVAKLKALAHKLGLKRIVFQASPASTLHALLIKNHTPTPSFPVLFQSFDSGLDLDQIKFTFADIDIF